MDKVEFLIVQPQILCIVHHKLDVRRHQRRLARTQINAEDFTFRELISKVNRPDSSPCADIETSLRLAQRREEKSVGVGYPQQMMLQIESIVLPFVVGEDVFAIFVS